MNPANYQNLLIALREHERQRVQKYVNSRTQPRFLPSTSTIIVNFEHPGGSISKNNALLVNISKEGACIATRSFLHDKTMISLNLITNDGEPFLVNGTVKWCTYFSEQSHQSGISFDEPIDPRNFVSAESWNESSDHSTNFEWTTNREALVINDDKLSFKMLQMLLKNANVTSTNVASMGEALDLVQQISYDFVFITDSADTTETEATISSLQSHGYSGPVLVESISQGTRQNALINAGATAVLQRPIQLAPLLTELRDSIESSTNPNSGSTPIFTTLTQEQCSDDFLNEYITAISKSSKKLAHSIINEDLETALRESNSLLASGSGFGYTVISNTAMTVIQSLNASQSVKESAMEIRKLIRLLARIHTRQLANP